MAQTKTRKAAPKKPAKRDLGRASFHKAHSNIRSIKMFYPEHRDNPDTGEKGCQDVEGADSSQWYKDCIKRGHEPYYRVNTRREVRPNLVEVCADCEEPEEGHPEAHVFIPSGKYLQRGTKEFTWHEETPNLEQVQVSPRVHGTLYGIDPLNWRRAWGRIFPGDHPTKPLADFCEYHNCWNQKVKVRCQYGNYCDEVAAKRVAMDYRGKSVEAFNQEKMLEQLDGVKLA